MSELNLSKIPVDNSYANDIQFLLGEVKDNQQGVKITLPSNGKLYEKYGCDGTVTLFPMKLKDEIEFSRILEKNKNAFMALEQLFKVCVHGIDAKWLTLSDKYYILFKLREISIGSNYVLEKSCDSCNQSNKIGVELSSLPTIMREPGLDDHVSVFELPQSKVKVTYRVAVFADEPTITSDAEIFENLDRFILQIEKEGRIFKDKTLIKTFLRNTLAADVKPLLRLILDGEYGFEKVVIFPCAVCGKDNKALLGLNSSFFS